MVSQPKYPHAARRHYLASALLAKRAGSEAQQVAKGGPGAVATVVSTHQIAQARMSSLAVPEMLTEQDITAPPDARLNPTAFTTDPGRFAAMWDATNRLDLLVESLVQDAGRAAESVASAVRPGVYHVRYLSSPSCSRCAILAGRVYRYSEGFLRHPHCDCVMVPTSGESHRLVQDPASLARAGLVTGLSKSDMQAVRDGADVGQVVNVRRSEAGLREPGRVLGRKGRPTPDGIYRIASTRDEAVALLGRYGYVL